MLQGCASRPIKQEDTSLIFPNSIEMLKEAAVDALRVYGFKIQKEEPSYIEGIRPQKWGFFVGSGGETAGVWLEALEQQKTRVYVDTAKSAAGILGQKNWSSEIMQEIRRNLKQ
jgi:hypothetical protein